MLMLANMIKIILFTFLLFSSFSWAERFPLNHPRKAEPNKIRGYYTDLYRVNYGDYSSITLKNATKYRLRCKWGIDGYQWVSYIGSYGKTIQLYYDNNLYTFNMVTFKCKKDKTKLNKQKKIGTYRIYPNQYY